MSPRKDILALIALSLSVALMFAAADVALAVDRRAEARAGFGQSSTLSIRALALDTIPLPPSPVAGSLTPGINDDDLFEVDLRAGERFEIEVTAEPGSDVDIFVLWPQATVLAPPYAASAISEGAIESLIFDAPVTGTYILDINLPWPKPATTYSATYSVADAANGNGYGRISGQNRYATAIAISAATFEAGSCEDVIIATGRDYPDAMTAGALAGALGSPLLLTDRYTLSPGVAEEIERLGVQTAHVAGGPAAVSDAVLSQLLDLGINVERFSGANRYAVAAGIAAAAKELGPASTGETVFLASGELFPDALSVSPYAYRMVYPTLLTRRGYLDSNTSAALTQLGTTRVYIAGGTSAISADVETALKNRGLEVIRLAGPNRYSTARATANYAIQHHWGDPSLLAVASGQVFPDALAGGAAYGFRGGVMLLTGQAALDPQAAAFADSWSDLGLVDDTRVLGGTAAVGTAASTSLRAIVVR